LTKQKTILVCPLDWGLGHATRCIPIIQQFLNQNCNVIIGSSGSQKVLLQQEFPNLTFIDLNGYEVEYPKSGSMALKMLLQLPKINTSIKEERRWLAKIIDEHQIDLVVSDNRYGLWSKKVKSVLITHQVFVKAPFGEWAIEKLLKRHFDNFNEIWIPDVEGENNLSGDLSHKKSLPDKFKFIGVLSRFSNQTVTSSVSPLCGTYREEKDFEYDFIAILSGPEPQRTIFENIILKQVENSNLKGILVRGLPEDNAECKMQIAELKVFNHLETVEFLHYLQESKVVISRSGYSTIMDLAALGKKAILVSTPGQTEQEYLADYHFKEGHFYSQTQNEFDLVKILDEFEDYKGIKLISRLNFPQNF
jgi:predicted glycosyltransferase